MRNEPSRVRYKCDNYEREILASINEELGSIQVKAFKHIHNCDWEFHGRMVIAKWLAMEYLEKFRSNPTMKLADIMNGVSETFNLQFLLIKDLELGRLPLRYSKVDLRINVKE